MRSVIVLLVSCGLLAFSERGAAQCNTSAKDKVTTTITPASQVIATPTATQFNAGASATVSYSVTISPTKGGTWFLCITSLSASFGTVNGYTKPVSDLEWSTDGITWTGLTTTAAQVKTGTGTLTVQVMVRSRLSWALDQPQSVAAPATYGPISFEFQALF